MRALRGWKKCNSVFSSLSSLSVEAPHCLGSVLAAERKMLNPMLYLCFKFFLFVFY